MENELISRGGVIFKIYQAFFVRFQKTQGEKNSGSEKTQGEKNSSSEKTQGEKNSSSEKNSMCFFSSPKTGALDALDGHVFVAGVGVVGRRGPGPPPRTPAWHAC